MQKATAVLVNTATAAITASGQNIKNQNLDVITSVKTLTGQIQESYADSIVCVLFEDEMDKTANATNKKAPKSTKAKVAFFALLPDPT